MSEEIQPAEQPLIEFDLNCPETTKSVELTPAAIKCNNPFDEIGEKAGLPIDVFDIEALENNPKTPPKSLCFFGSPGCGKPSALNYALLNHRQLTAKRLPFFSKSPGRPGSRNASDPGLLKTKQSMDILQKLRSCSVDKSSGTGLLCDTSILNLSQMNDSLDDLNSVRLNLVDSDNETENDLDEMCLKFKMPESNVHPPNEAKLIDIEEISPKPIEDSVPKEKPLPCDEQRQEQLRQVLNEIKERKSEEENAKFFKQLQDDVDTFILKNEIIRVGEARELLRKLIDLLSGKEPEAVEYELPATPLTRQGTFEIKKSPPEVHVVPKTTSILNHRRSMSDTRRTSQCFGTKSSKEVSFSFSTPSSTPANRRRSSVTFSKENIAPSLPPSTNFVKPRPRRSFSSHTPNTKLKNFTATTTTNNPPVISKLKLKKAVSTIEKSGPIKAIVQQPQSTAIKRESLNPQMLRRSSAVISSTPNQDAAAKLDMSAIVNVTPMKRQLQTPSKMDTPSSRIGTPSRLAIPYRLLTPVRPRASISNLRRNSLGQYNSPN